MQTPTGHVPGNRLFVRDRSTRRTTWIGIAAAIFLAEVVWFAATHLGGLALQAPASQANSQPASIGPIVVGVASFVASLLAWSLAAGIQRFTRFSRGVWLGVGLSGLLVSLIMPLGGWGVSIADRLVLVAMHVAVAAVVVSTIYLTWRPATHTSAPGHTSARQAA
jgi:hypothetical protein